MNVSKPAARRPGKLRGLIGLSLGGYVVVLVLLVVFENSLIFPAPRFPAGDWEPTGLNVEDVTFPSGDGTALHGWLVRQDQPAGYLLFCHGNGEHVAHLADLLRLLTDQYRYTVFAFDYRGYGRSDGSPNEAGILADAQAAREWFQDELQVSSSEVILMGRSLGGAVAIDLAAVHPPRALIVESTFTSLPDVAARLYWWAPVRWLMRSQFNSLDKIRGFEGPLMISHGARDTLIPISHGRTLFAAAASSEKEFLEYPEDGHNDARPREYYDRVREFVDAL